MTRRTIEPRAKLLALLILLTVPQGAAALGTAFTYQGQLEQSGSLATGACDFRFRLFDSAGSGSPPIGGTQIGFTALSEGVQVANGLFTVQLDFGAAAFNIGSDRWLQIAVRCPGGGGEYATLAPRQPLTPAPYALFAGGVTDGSVTSAKLAPGAVTTSQLAPNAVTAAQIADGTIATGDLANGAVSTAQLAPGAVTTSQLAPNVVTAAQIADGTIATGDLANGAVSTAKIGDGQVTGAKLVTPLRLTSAAANTTIGALDGTSTGSNGVGVSGKAGTGVNSAGVFGSATAGAGVRGESSNGEGVRGTSSNGTGVYGEGVGDPGVWGESNDDGVFGVSTGAGDGVSGVAMQGAGVHGESLDGTGVLGEGTELGVKGTSATGDGIMGVSTKEFGIGAGVVGIATGLGMPTGVRGESTYIGVAGSGTAYGVQGYGGTGVYGLTDEPDGDGVRGESRDANDANGVGVRASANQGIALRAQSGSGLAGLFVGPVVVNSSLTVNGAVFAGAKFFRIDHPLDPANKYLMHAAVESPELKNLYDGVVVLDANGEAGVDLPPWFEALNRDFRYQLTCIGGVAPVYVADEVSEGRFRIAGGTPGLKVSWQVTGVRKDAYAVAHPLAVEAEKTAAERGRYLHPVEQGAPAALSVDRATDAPLP